MKTVSAIILLAGLIIIAGCSGGQHIELTKAGESALQEGDFRKALEYSEQIIGEVEGKGRQAAGNVYTLAGVSAFELENYDKSLKYLIKAQQQEYSEGDLYLYLARNYRYIDNLSKEITALETYLAKYPDGKNIGAVRETILFFQQPLTQLLK